MVRIEKTQYAEPQRLIDGDHPTALILVLFANGVAQIWTNAGDTIEEIYNTTVNRARVDLRHYSQYKIVVTLTTVNAGANSIMGVEYSLDGGSQFSNLTDGIDDTIPPVNAGSAPITAATGVIQGGWTDIVDAAKVDNVMLSAHQTCDVATGDPAFTKVEVHFRN